MQSVYLVTGKSGEVLGAFTTQGALRAAVAITWSKVEKKGRLEFESVYTGSILSEKDVLFATVRLVPVYDEGALL